MCRTFYFNAVLRSSGTLAHVSVVSVVTFSKNKTVENIHDSFVYIIAHITVLKHNLTVQKISIKKEAMNTEDNYSSYFGVRVGLH